MNQYFLIIGYVAGLLISSLNLFVFIRWCLIRGGNRRRIGRAIYAVLWLNALVASLFFGVALFLQLLDSLEMVTEVQGIIAMCGAFLGLVVGCIALNVREALGKMLGRTVEWTQIISLESINLFVFSLIVWIYDSKWKEVTNLDMALTPLLQSVIIFFICRSLTSNILKARLANTNRFP